MWQMPVVFFLNDGCRSAKWLCTYHTTGACGSTKATQLVLALCTLNNEGGRPQTSLTDVPVGEVVISQTVDNPWVKPAWTKPAQSLGTQTCGPAKVTLAGAGKTSRSSVNILSTVGAS